MTVVSRGNVLAWFVWYISNERDSIRSLSPSAYLPEEMISKTHHPDDTRPRVLEPLCATFCRSVGRPATPRKDLDEAIECILGDRIVRPRVVDGIDDGLKHLGRHSLPARWCQKGSRGVRGQDAYHPLEVPRMIELSGRGATE